MDFLKQIDHIGIAVSNLNSSIQTYQLLGLKVSHIEEVSEMDVKVAFFPFGNSRLELLEPLSSDSVIAKFIEKRGEGIHHICFEVKDIHKALRRLKSQGVSLVYEKPQKGSENSLVSFIHPKSAHGVLIELRQKVT